MVRVSSSDALPEGKRFRRDHGTIMTGKWQERSAMKFGFPSIDPSVLSFEIRLVEQDFDEGGNDLGIEKDRRAAEDLTCDLSLCLLCEVR